jgi:hypothetical protein
MNVGVAGEIVGEVLDHLPGVVLQAVPDSADRCPRQAPSIWITLGYHRSDTDRWSSWLEMAGDGRKWPGGYR